MDEDNHEVGKKRTEDDCDWKLVEQPKGEHTSQLFGQRDWEMMMVRLVRRT